MFEKIIVLVRLVTESDHQGTFSLVKDLFLPLLTNFVTIIIALIAGLIALYQVKLNVIATARISWIENLRESISSYCTEVTHCGLIISNMHDDCTDNPEENTQEIIAKHYPDYKESSYRLEKLRNKVLLYLNSKEQNHRKIEEQIDIVHNKLHKERMEDVNVLDLEKDARLIINYSKLIFKNEWEKSKRLLRS